MKKIILQSIVVSSSILSAILVFSVVFNWHGNFMLMGTIAEGKKDSSIIVVH